MTSIVITGLHYLIGKTVSAFIAGLDCGDYSVDQYGQITVPEGSDPSGLFGASWLCRWNNPGAYGDLEMVITISDDVGSTPVNVPVVIGYNYVSQGQLLRPYLADRVKSNTGPALAKRRRAHRIEALTYRSAGLEFGTNFSDMQPATLRDGADTAMPVEGQLTGVYREELRDDFTYDTMLSWQIVRPYPATIVQVGAALETEDE